MNDRKYRQSQLSRTDVDCKPFMRAIRISAGCNQTNYLNITEKEYQTIKQILLKEAKDYE